MRALKTNKVFFSVFQANESEWVNQANHEYVLATLYERGITFRVVKGVYKGVAELSILLESNDISKHIDNVSTAIELATMYKQESIMSVNHDDSAYLMQVKHGDAFPMGTFREATESEATQVPNYTFDPLSGRYFVVD